MPVPTIPHLPVLDHTTYTHTCLGHILPYLPVPHTLQTVHSCSSHYYLPLPLPPATILHHTTDSLFPIYRIFTTHLFPTTCSSPQASHTPAHTFWDHFVCGGYLCLCLCHRFTTTYCGLGVPGCMPAVQFYHTYTCLYILFHHLLCTHLHALYFSAARITTVHLYCSSFACHCVLYHFSPPHTVLPAVHGCTLPGFSHYLPPHTAFRSLLPATATSSPGISILPPRTTWHFLLPAFTPLPTCYIHIFFFYMLGLVTVDFWVGFCTPGFYAPHHRLLFLLFYQLPFSTINTTPPRRRCLDSHSSLPAALHTPHTLHAFTCTVGFLFAWSLPGSWTQPFSSRSTTSFAVCSTCSCCRCAHSSLHLQLLTCL